MQLRNILTVLIICTIYLHEKKLYASCPRLTCAEDSHCIVDRCACLPPNTQHPMNDHYAFRSLTITSSGILELCSQGFLHITVAKNIKINGTIRLNGVLKNISIPGWLNGILGTSYELYNRSGTFGKSGSNGGNINLQQRLGSVLYTRLNNLSSPESLNSTLGETAEFGGDGGDGGNIFHRGMNGTNGGKGGDGGKALRKDFHTYIVSYLGGNGGIGGTAGTGGKAGSFLFLEARTLNNQGNINLQGQNGNSGNVGLWGSSGNSHNIFVYGMGIRASYARKAGAAILDCILSIETAWHFSFYSGWSINYLESSGRGAGGSVCGYHRYQGQNAIVTGSGAGGKGAGGGGGGGGGGGFALLKIGNIIRLGNIQVNGGLGGSGGAGHDPNRAHHSWDGAGGIITYEQTMLGVGGGGGGGGGAGGNGGAGNNGKVIIFTKEYDSIDCSRTDINCKNLQAGFTFSDIQITHLNSKQYVNHWINVHGIKNIYDNHVNWITLQNVRPKQTNFTGGSVGATSIQYTIKSNCQNANNQTMVQYPFHTTEGVMDGSLRLYQTNRLYSLYHIPTLSNNQFFAPYEVCDGLNYLNIQVQDFFGKFYTLKQYPIFLDQYAPCDNIMDHCELNLYNDDPNNSNDIQNHITGTNQNHITLSFLLAENQGSGINTSGEESNIRLYAVKQIQQNNTSILQTLSGVPISLGTPDHYNISCDHSAWDLPTIAQLNYQQIINQKFTYTFDLSQADSGTYWIFACLKDRAGNWSFLHEIPVGQSNWAGKINKQYLGIFKAQETNGGMLYGHSNDAEHVLAYVPALHTRFILDKPEPDAIECSTDPCMVKPLNPSVGFTTATELDASNVRIAYNPVSWTNSNRIQIGIKKPYDLSGIHKIYYYIGKKVTSNLVSVNVWGKDHSSHLCKLIVQANNAYQPSMQHLFDENNQQRTNNWIDFCFEIDSPYNEGNHIFLWLEDITGNRHNQESFISRPLFIDIRPPEKINKFYSLQNPTASFNPTLQWEIPYDKNGIKQYLICYYHVTPNNQDISIHAVPNTRCPSSSLLGDGIIHSSNVSTQQHSDQLETYSITKENSLETGYWNFTITAIDIAGNYSLRSSIYQLLVYNHTAFLDFTHEDEVYKKSTVRRIDKYKYLYTFKIQYIDYKNYPPQKHQIWLDMNGDHQYESKEKFDMVLKNHKQPNDQQLQYSWFYEFKIALPYLSSTQGILYYHFKFKNNTTTIQSKPKHIDLLEEQMLWIDPYDLNSFTGILQVRNNVVRPSSIYLPTILIKPSQKPKKDIIKLAVYSETGHIIKTLIDNITYDKLERTYLKWDVKDQQGRNVPSGVYYIVYYNGTKKSYKRVVVIN